MAYRSNRYKGRRPDHLFNISRTTFQMMRDRGYKPFSEKREDGSLMYPIAYSEEDDVTTFLKKITERGVADKMAGFFIKEDHIGNIQGLVYVYFDFSNITSKISKLPVTKALQKLIDVENSPEYKNSFSENADKYVVFVSESQKLVSNTKQGIEAISLDTEGDQGIQIFGWLSMNTNLFSDDSRHNDIPLHTRVPFEEELDSIENKERLKESDDVIVTRQLLKKVVEFEALPQISIDDPVVRWWNWKVGDIIRIVDDGITRFRRVVSKDLNI